MTQDDNIIVLIDEDGNEAYTRAYHLYELR